MEHPHEEERRALKKVAHEAALALITKHSRCGARFGVTGQGTKDSPFTPYVEVRGYKTGFFGSSIPVVVGDVHHNVDIHYIQNPAPEQ